MDLILIAYIVFCETGVHDDRQSVFKTADEACLFIEERPSNKYHSLYFVGFEVGKPAAIKVLKGTCVPVPPMPTKYKIEVEGAR